MTIEEKLKKAQALGKKPVELSEPEEEVLDKIITTLKEGLDQVLEEALKMPRDEAFKKVNRYVYALIRATHPDAPSIEETVEEEAEETKKVKPKLPVKPVVHPKLENLLKELPEDKRGRALIVLSCIKAHNKLEEEEEDGSQALCPDCTPEKMLACINVEDPRVVDELEQELRKAGVVRA